MVSEKAIWPMGENRPKLIAVVGPTAVGKTRFAIELATELGCPVVSADSRQFYREISIGTAKPTQEEMKGVPHLFIDSHSVSETFSAGDFEKAALDLLQSLFQVHPQVVLVGGSGMYVNALCFGLDEMPPADERLRAELQALFEAQGLTALQEKLKATDPHFFEICEQKNPQRLMRALEVCLSTGKSNLEFRKRHSRQKRFFDVEFIGLEMPREKLNQRINQRVDEMVAMGLLEEAKAMLPYREHYALKTVGYREMFMYLDGLLTFEQAVELVKKNTRDYAKKQMTWFKKNKEVKWHAVE